MYSSSIFLLSNPLIYNLLTFFFLIFFGFCFLQDYGKGQIYVVLASFHNTHAKASRHIDPTPIGVLQMMFQFHSKLILRLIMLLQPVFPMTKLLYMSTSHKRLMSLFDDHFWNQYFETKLHKHRKQLESINGFLSLLIVNIQILIPVVFSATCKIIQLQLTTWWTWGLLQEHRV